MAGGEEENGKDEIFSRERWKGTSSAQRAHTSFECPFKEMKREGGAASWFTSIDNSDTAAVTAALSLSLSFSLSIISLTTYTLYGSGNDLGRNYPKVRASLDCYLVGARCQNKEEPSEERDEATGRERWWRQTNCNEYLSAVPGNNRLAGYFDGGRYTGGGVERSTEAFI